MRAHERVRFVKSSFSMSGDCVLWGVGSGVVYVSDSKDPAGLVLETSLSDWMSFTSCVERDASPAGSLRASCDDLGWRVFLAGDPGQALRFTDSEWHAYQCAITTGEVYQRHAS
jgi:hypothetical protein